MARHTKRPRPSAPDSLPHALRIAALAAEHKAIDIRAYDLRGLTLITDSFVICSASSQPHVKAIMDAVREGMKTRGRLPLHSEGSASDNWLVLDYGDAIFHVFREEARAYYDLDGLWADAPQIALDGLHENERSHARRTTR